MFKNFLFYKFYLITSQVKILILVPKQMKNILNQILIRKLEMTLLLKETINSQVLVLNNFKSKTITLFIKC